MKQTLKFLTLGLLTSGLFVLAKAPVAHAATLTVNSTADTAVQDDGDCTLREAINNVNAGSDTTDGGAGGDCIAADGVDDTVMLPSGTITLTANLPAITESIVIEGEGMDVTVVNGASLYGGIDSQGTDFTLKKITLTAMRDMGVLARGDGNVTYEEIEVDGSGWQMTDPTNVSAGIVAGTSPTADTTVVMKNIYVHDFMVDSSQFFPAGAIAGGTANTLVIADNITISNNTNTGIVQAFMIGSGLFDGGATPARVSARVNNLTIDHNTSTNSTVTGVSLAVINNDTITASSSLRNITITNLSGGGTSPFLGSVGTGAAIAVVAAAGVHVDALLTVANLLVADNNFNNCATSNIGPAIGGYSGTVATTITSQGGNLSDDTSCSPYFTQPTDQNNLTTLGTTLEALSDNGGFVPTIALKQGSPAIDSGITIAGLTNDARLAVRPQGSAYDSGAYESPFTKPVAVLASTGTPQLLISIVALGMILSGTVLYRFKIAI